MYLGDFVERYGASFRRKNVVPLPETPLGRIAFAIRLFRGRQHLVNRRIHFFPRASPIPREFIRLDPWEAEYVFLIASQARLGVVEIGRLHGGSTFLLACANREVPIWSIDIAPRDDERLSSLLTQEGVGENVRLLVGDSRHEAPAEIGRFDVLFVDGDHSTEGCAADLETYYPALAPGGHLLLHDAYPGTGVQDAAIDFARRHEPVVVRSPYIIASHWHTDYGSIAHFVKPENEHGPRLRAT
jgi:predicted O-methyltransferase YrrM